MNQENQEPLFLNWENLITKKCPKCGRRLLYSQKTNRYYCKGFIKKNCAFVIGAQKLAEIQRGVYDTINDIENNENIDET